MPMRNIKGNSIDRMNMIPYGNLHKDMKSIGKITIWVHVYNFSS